MENSVCELKKMYLLPEGRGLGLGQILLDKVLSYAKKKGYKQCYLETLQSMDKTSRLYKKTGFIWLDKPIEEMARLKNLWVNSFRIASHEFIKLFTDRIISRMVSLIIRMAPVKTARVINIF